MLSNQIVENDSWPPLATMKDIYTTLAERIFYMLFKDSMPSDVTSSKLHSRISVAKEVQRRMQVYTFTKYEKSRDIFEKTGTYFRVIEDAKRGVFSYTYDCTGFVTHVLLKSSRKAHDEMKKTMKIGDRFCPSPATWKSFFQMVNRQQNNFQSWKPVTKVTDLRPGDVLVRPGGSVGHVMIIMSTPERMSNTGNFKVKISDSTGSPHSDDTRPSKKGKTGMGTGYIRLVSGMKMAWSLWMGGSTLPVWAGRPMG